MTFDPGGAWAQVSGAAQHTSLIAVARLKRRSRLLAPAQKIVSVDMTGNLRVPTQTIMSVIAARPGQP